MKRKLILLPVAVFMLAIPYACSSEVVTTTLEETTTTTDTISITETITETPTETETVSITETISTTTMGATTQTTTASFPRGSKENPVLMGESYYIPDDIEITIVNLIQGEQAWAIVDGVQRSNDPPSPGMQYVIITVHVEYLSMEDPARWIKDDQFELIGSSGQLFNSVNRSIIIPPDQGDLKELRVGLYKNEEDTGSLYFLIPEGESNLVLIWDSGFTMEGTTSRFLEVK
jgi:hypothetical protein